MKKGVTLIELMVVITVLGILAALAIPNIKNIKNQAILSQVGEDKANVQKSVDRFSLEKGQFPTDNGSVPSLAIPKQVDFTKLSPPYLIEKPANLEKIYYWIDYFGTVWASDIDSPTNIQTANSGGGQYTITWDFVSGASSYNVGYAIFEPSASRNTADINAEKSRYVWLQQGVSDINVTINSPSIDLTAAKIVVNAVSKNNLQTVPVENGYTGSLLEGQAPNQKPTAVITMTPENSINTVTNITWSYSSSTDPEGDSLTYQWTVDGSVVVNPPSTFTEGPHTVELKVTDSKGLESDVATKTFIVAADTGQLDTLQLGEYVKYGKFNGYDLTWQVVKKQSGDVMLFMTTPVKSGDGSLLPVRYDWGANAGEPIDVNNYRISKGSNNYEYSSLRVWLNGTFYNTAFTNKTYIKDTTHDFILTTMDYTAYFGVQSGITGSGPHTYNTVITSSKLNYDTAYKKSISDKVYLISIKEIDENIYPVIGVNVYNASYSYWLRDSKIDAYSQRVMYKTAQIIADAVDSNNSVRAAINLKSATFSSGSGTQANPYVIQ